MEEEKLEFFRDLLNTRLNALLAEAAQELREFSDDKEALADILDIASMESNREFTLRIRERERSLIFKIKSALERVDSGEYGYCVTCGELIGEKRLMARPVATLCIDCKTEAEQLERGSRSF